MKDYSIPRKEAGEIAWISLRTLDRYVLSKKIDYKKIKWRVLFSELDLLEIKQEKNIETVSEWKTNFDFKKEKTEHKTVEIPEDKNQKNISTNNFWENFWELVKMVQIKAERDSFKTMFEIANKDLKEKQTQLEQVNFKLWEILAKQDLPKLELKWKSEEISDLKRKIKESEEISKSLQNEISFQKFIKTVFVIILLLTVSILSFWYVYNFKI